MSPSRMVRSRASAMMLVSFFQPISLWHLPSHTLCDRLQSLRGWSFLIKRIIKKPDGAHCTHYQGYSYSYFPCCAFCIFLSTFHTADNQEPNTEIIWVVQSSMVQPTSSPSMINWRDTDRVNKWGQSTWEQPSTTYERMLFKQSGFKQILHYSCSNFHSCSISPQQPVVKFSLRTNFFDSKLTRPSHLCNFIGCWWPAVLVCRPEI